MSSRRATYLGLLGVVVALWALAFGCSLDTTGFGDSDEACTTDAHCDDGNICTNDVCGDSGTCVHSDADDGLYPDGITGNCKVLECKAGVQSDTAAPDDVDDGDECTKDECDGMTPSHAIQAGKVCHSGGGIGVCKADGSCSIECGFIDADGSEVGCPPSDDACSISYCDKAQGKCALDALDGVPSPDPDVPAPNDCGGTYCKQGKSVQQFAPQGSACADSQKPTAIVCNDAGKCVGCNDAADCNPNDIPTSFCFTATCTNEECNVTTQPDGAVLPAAMQIVGDCLQKQCASLVVQDVPLDSDVNDDLNLCTADSCAGGLPLHIPTAKNSPCGANGTLYCDGAGTCQNCTEAAQCGTNTDCHQFACNSGTCADIYPPVDTPVSAAGQVVGDCLLQVCDGAGGIKPNANDADLPNDANDCTLDQCSGGMKVFPPVAVGSVCSQNRICDAGGNCLGGTCQGVADCPAGAFCVDGVCCNSDCSTPCAACTRALKGNMGLNGECGISAVGTDNNDTDCPGPKVCDGTLGAGACKLPVGQACSVAGECLLGFCTDGFCCDNACNGVCQVCNAMGAQGTCTPIPFGQDPANECPGSINCNGTSACGNTFGNGTACAMGTECASGFCTDGVCCSAACGGTCQACNLGGSNGTCTNIPVEQDPANECAGTLVCSGAGACGKPKGTACAMGSECASGFCVDGVCCNAACGGTCQACNLAAAMGTCTPIPSGQDPASECSGAVNCNGNGACAFFTNGTACSMGSECASNNCIDGVCCNNACGGACKACNVAGNVGTCTNIPNNQDPANECTGAQVCNGNGACVGGPLGAVCAMGSECGSTNCIDGVCCNNACGALCQACNVAGSIGTCSGVPNGTDPANECTGVTNCNGAGACALLAIGAACSVGGECASGNCVDGVCCNTACGSTCQACNLAGTVGTCTSIPNNQDPANECANGACNGAGVCKLDNGQICAMGSACLSNNCVDGVCCNSACGSLCQACNVAGSVGACTNVPSGTDPASECAGVTNCNGAGACGLLALGAACSVGGECTSGNCVDGVCCSTAACAGTCKSCNQADTVGGVAGVCDNIKVNVDPGNECSGALSCNGSGACQLALGGSCSTAAQCGSGNCVDGVCCSTAACAGTCKSCNQADTVGGVAGVCDNIKVNVDPGNECTGALSCDGAGTCQLALGGSCSAAAQCGSGNCVDGVCCSTGTCSGTCKSCNQADTVGGVAGVCDNIKVNTDPDTECSGALSCDGAGACQLGPGGSCSTGSQCGSGNCVDSVCCSSPSCGTCQTCNGGTPGTCTNIAIDGTDNNPVGTCTGNNSCDGAGACKKNVGQGCGVSTECVHGNCVDNFCCNNACSGTCAACSNALTGAANGTCANIPMHTDPQDECSGAEVCDAGVCVAGPLGAACVVSGADASCESGFCSDGVCCDSLCTGECKACTAAKKGAGSDGTCGNIATGTNPDLECSGVQVCNAAGACAPP